MPQPPSTAWFSHFAALVERTEVLCACYCRACRSSGERTVVKRTSPLIMICVAAAIGLAACSSQKTAETPPPPPPPPAYAPAPAPEPYMAPGPPRRHYGKRPHKRVHHRRRHREAMPTAAP